MAMEKRNKMTNLERFHKLVSAEATNTIERAKQRIAKRKATKYRRIFPYQLIHDDDLWDMRNDAYERGFNAAKRQATDFLTDKQQYDCRTLTEVEKETVMRFLDYNSLEFGYNVESGGFYVLKRTR